MSYGVQAKIEDFDRRNGGAPAMLHEWLYFTSGAKREVWPHGALIDPPKDDFQRLSHIVCYHQARLNKAVAEFDALKEQLLMAGHSDPSRLDELRELQTVVGARNAALVEAKRLLGETDEAKRRDSHRHGRAAEQARTEAFRNTVREIRV